MYRREDFMILSATWADGWEVSLASQTVEKWPQPILRKMRYRPLEKESMMWTAVRWDQVVREQCHRPDGGINQSNIR